MGAGNRSVSPHSLASRILSAEAKAEARAPLRVIAIDNRAPVDLKRATLAEAAEHLTVVEAHSPDDLSGINVVTIPGGQEKHPLYENAESRRRSRMLG